MTYTDKHSVRQEVLEHAMCAMSEFICSANDLEAQGDTTDARELRELAGKIDEFVTGMRLRHS